MLNDATLDEWPFGVAACEVEKIFDVAELDMGTLMASEKIPLLLVLPGLDEGSSMVIN